MEGDVQIFDNPECTRYATGVKNQGDKVYARVNVPCGFGEGWWAGDGDGDNIACYAPIEESPDDTYGLSVWYYEMSADYTQPFTAGQVVELDGRLMRPGSSGVDVTNYQKVFTKP